MIVRIYCWRTNTGYWGLGLTPEEAIATAVKAGARKSDKGGMVRLPKGVTECGVDNMGCCWWKDGEAHIAEDMEKVKGKWLVPGEEKAA